MSSYISTILSLLSHFHRGLRDLLRRIKKFDCLFRILQNTRGKINLTLLSLALITLCTVGGFQTPFSQVEKLVNCMEYIILLKIHSL